MVELTEFLVKSLVKDPEMVSVKQFDDEDDVMIIQVLVNEEEMGAIIGRGGNIANSIRTIVQASAYTNGEKKVRINIDSF
jgi:predicted RNA-binding protein YlqC (UPF0109 family)